MIATGLLSFHTRFTSFLFRRLYHSTAEKEDEIYGFTWFLVFLVNWLKVRTKVSVESLCVRTFSQNMFGPRFDTISTF
jgi:hypothetical protein